jgi:hypothetical protein
MSGVIITPVIDPLCMTNVAYQNIDKQRGVKRSLDLRKTDIRGILYHCCWCNYYTSKIRH